MADRGDEPRRYGRRDVLAASVLGPAAAAAAALPSGTPATAQGRAPASTPIVSPELEDQIRLWMKAACVPGLALARIERGAVMGSWQVGVGNADTREPVTESTLFEACSMSKPVFAYGVLKLSEAGLIDLDRPLASYFLPAYFPDDPQIRTITARHVLTHSSGLPPWGNENRPETLQPTFPPGRYFSYSGEGYFWLQLVVEEITGIGLDPLMRTHVFEPAGMHSSFFTGFAALAPRAAFGHHSGKVASDQGWRNVLDRTEPRAAAWGKPVRDWTHRDWLRAGAEIVPSNPPKRVRFTNAAASLLTTPDDFARFLILCMDRRQQASWQVSDDLRRQMISPQIAVQEGSPVWWGLGWQIERGPAGLLFGHEGNNDNRFTSYSGGDAARGSGLVVLANAGGGFGVYQRIVRALTGLDRLTFIADVNPPRP
jgi:CubicO group peptidase (beta-lactamase class C family)